MSSELSKRVKEILDNMGYPYDDLCMKSIVEKMKHYETFNEDDVENELLYYARMNE